MRARQIAITLLAGLGAYGAWQAFEGQPPPWALGSQATGCDPSRGSSVAFPTSGPLALSAEHEAQKKAALRLAKVVSGGAKEDFGFVWFVNSGDDAAEATLFDEDGAPAARAFIRAGEQARVEVEPGAYTAWVVSGPDWDGKRMVASCASARAPRGVAVVGPGQAAMMAIAPGRGFAMGNRLDKATAEGLIAEAAKAGRRGLAPGESGRAGEARERPQERPEAEAPKASDPKEAPAQNASAR